MQRWSFMDDLKNIEQLVAAYIAKNFQAGVSEPSVVMQDAFGDVELDEVDFLKLFAQAKTGCETFSEMLKRLIAESGEKN